jgi:hypothetical protein
MRRLVPSLICVLLCGCATPSYTHAVGVAVKCANGIQSSGGAVFRIGPITESGNLGPITESENRPATGTNGDACRHRLTIDKIEDNGVTLTIYVSNSSQKEWKKQIFISYGSQIITVLQGKITVEVSSGRIEASPSRSSGGR